MPLIRQLHMRHLTICLLVPFLMLFSGCWNENTYSDSGVESDSPEQLARSGSHSHDHAVLNAVLRDLLSYSGDDSPLLDKGNAPKELTFDKESVAYRQTTEDILYEYRKEPWWNLESNQLQSARIAAANLVRRIESEDFVVKFMPDDKRVSPANTEKNGDRAIQAWPPGYSADKQVAVVRMVVPWSSIHHAESTHILQMSGDEWIVVLRQFVYYP